MPCSVAAETFTRRFPASGDDAGDLQRNLLPPSPLAFGRWSAAHRFQPAGASPVSGDYVDLVPHRDRLYFMLGDVSGKGPAASMLSVQLHATMRALIPFELPLEDLLTRASALLCATSLPAQYATLVAGYLEPDGTAVISNAGHPTPISITRDGHVDLASTGLPIGMFCESQFASARLTLAPGDTLLLYSDGMTEAWNDEGDEYGTGRLKDTVARFAGQPVDDLLGATLRDQARFRGGLPNRDDLTLLAIRRT